MKTTVPGLFLFALAFHILFHIVTLAGVVHRRHKFPLSGRVVWLLVPIWMAFGGYGAFQLAEALTDTGCVSVFLFEAIIVFPGILAEYLRVLRLWIFYYSAEELLKIRDTEALKVVDPNVKVPTAWFTKKKKYFRFSFLGKVYAAMVSVTTALTAVVFVNAPPNPDLYYFFISPGCQTMPATMMFSHTILVLGVVAVLVTAWKIRNVSDGYFMVTEYKLSALSAVAILIARLYVGRSPAVAGGFAIQNLLAALACMLGTASFLMYPLYKGRQKKYANLARVSSIEHQHVVHQLTMSDLLANRSYELEKRSFLSHIVKEFAMDQLLFYEAAVDFAACATKWDSKTLCSNAMEIYDKFIRRDADQEANISHTIRTSIDEEFATHISGFDPKSEQDSDISYALLGTMSTDVFETARSVVYRMLSNDTYARWKAKYVVSAKDRSSHDRDRSPKLELDMADGTSVVLK